MKQSPYAWFAKFSKLTLSQGLNSFEVDLIVFQSSNLFEFVVLAVYVDDILVTRSDAIGIAHVKAYLHQHLKIWNLGTPKYVLASSLLIDWAGWFSTNENVFLIYLQRVDFKGANPISY